jgi:hypothetical protein
MDRLFSVTERIPTWASNEFRVHLLTNVVFLTNSIYSTAQSAFRPAIPARFELTAELLDINNPVYLMITNRLVYVLIDEQSSRVVDFVNLNNMINQINLTRELAGSAFGQDSIERSLWDREMGMTNQIQISLGNIETRGIWNSYSQDPVSGDNVDKSIDRFRAFFGLNPLKYPRARDEMDYTLAVQTPFNPTRKFVVTASLQVNDPLVHYTMEDLVGGRYSNRVDVLKPPTRAVPPSNLGFLNEKYRPWGGNPGKDNLNDPTAYSVAYKDPLVRRSDDWQFPTNLFPNLGWLGRVHRGTPWQTVYLKSTAAEVRRWTLDWASRVETHPTNDWWLVDLFTTAINENAARGLLSVNQANTAAWSAVLSGVSVLSNAPPSGVSFEIQPTSPQLRAIVDDINATRANQPAQAFTHLGGILAVPSLSVASPFLGPDRGTQADAVGNDVFYERIPQQILSLIKADEPKLVIYSLGQTLRPAPNSLLLEPGAYYRMCTNYEVTAETATKTVVRIEGPPNNLRAVTESYNILPAE